MAAAGRRNDRCLMRIPRDGQRLLKDFTLVHHDDGVSSRLNTDSPCDILFPFEQQRAG